MRQPEFTLEAIIQAGLELQAAGERVNGFSIRKRLGGGNASRIKQIWDEHNIQTPVKAEPVELPAELGEKVATVTQALVEQIAALAAAMNTTAVQTAERRVAEVLRSAGEQRDQAEHELRDAAEAVEDLEDQLDAAKANTDALEKRLSETQFAAQALAVELAQVREGWLQTEKNAGRASEAHADELARLHGSIEAERARHRAELDEAKKAIKGVEGERDQMRGELATVKARAEEQKKGGAAEAHRTAERLTKAQTERDQARAEAGAAREESARLAGLVEGLQGQVKDLMSALAKPVNQKVKP